MLDESKITATVTKWADETKQRVLDNLKRRGVVAQLPLVSNIDYTINIDTEKVVVSFAFGRGNSKIVRNVAESKNFLQAQRIGLTKSLSVYDSLTGTYKLFLGKDRGKSNLGFLRRANVYNLIQTTYAEELSNNVLKELPDLIGRFFVKNLE